MKTLHGWCRRAEKRLRSWRLSSSESSVFVVAECASTPHDDNDNTATTTAFVGGISATQRTVNELTISDHQRDDDICASQPNDDQNHDLPASGPMCIVSL